MSKYRPCLFHVSISNFIWGLSLCSARMESTPWGSFAVACSSVDKVVISMYVHLAKEIGAG